MIEALMRTAFEKPRDEDVERGKQLTPEEQVSCIMATVSLMADRSNPRHTGSVNALLRWKLPFTPEQILRLAPSGADPTYYFPFAQVVRLAKTIPLTPALEEALRKMRGARLLEHARVGRQPGYFAQHRRTAAVP
jgi:hypothetical protein